MRGVHQKLLGNAAHVDAGASHVAILGDSDARAEASGDAGGANAPRARSDDEQVAEEEDGIGYGKIGRMRPATGVAATPRWIGPAATAVVIVLAVWAWWLERPPAPLPRL